MNNTLCTRSQPLLCYFLLQRISSSSTDYDNDRTYFFAIIEHREITSNDPTDDQSSSSAFLCSAWGIHLPKGGEKPIPKCVVLLRTRQIMKWSLDQVCQMPPPQKAFGKAWLLSFYCLGRLIDWFIVVFTASCCILVPPPRETMFRCRECKEENDDCCEYFLLCVQWINKEGDHRLHSKRSVLFKIVPSAILGGAKAGEKYGFGGSIFTVRGWVFEWVSTNPFG